MTTITYRLNIKTMFCGITKMMMIFLGLFMTKSTLKNIRRLKLFLFDSFVYNIFGVCFFWIKIVMKFAFSAKFFTMVGFVFLRNPLYYFFAVLALVISFYSFCCFWGTNILTAIFFITNFAIGLIFVPFALIELRNRFNLFTHTTTSCFHIMNVADYLECVNRK